MGNIIAGIPFYILVNWQIFKGNRSLNTSCNFASNENLVVRLQMVVFAAQKDQNQLIAWLNANYCSRLSTWRVSYVDVTTTKRLQLVLQRLRQWLVPLSCREGE